MGEKQALKPHATIPKPDGPVLVCILDGYGENEFKDTYNAVEMAETPCFDSLRAKSDRFRCVVFVEHVSVPVQGRHLSVPHPCCLHRSTGIRD